MNLLQPIRAGLLAALILLPLPACTAAPKYLPTTGQVLEEATNKPLSGVIVVAHWLGTVSGLGGHGGTVCRHVETATTDAQGYYSLPRWEDRGPNLIYSYKVGYERSEVYGKIRTFERVVELMRKSIETPAIRIKTLARLSDAVECAQAGDSRMNLLPIEKAAYEEARLLTKSPEDQRVLDSLLFGVESLQFGDREALNRLTERRGVTK